MTDCKAIDAGKGYTVRYRDDKPDVITLEWNNCCIGMINAGEETVKDFLNEIESGKDIEDSWKIMGMGNSPLESMAPLNPYFVFTNDGEKTAEVFNSLDLETAQQYAFDLVEKSEKDITAYVCFNSGKYYVDGTIACVNNIISKGAPRKTLPFKKVLSMDIDVAQTLIVS